LKAPNTKIQSRSSQHVMPNIKNTRTKLIIGERCSYLTVVRALQGYTPWGYDFFEGF
jgi:hypothetical protein